MRIAVLAMVPALLLAGCIGPSAGTELDPIGGQTGHPLEGQAAPTYNATDLEGNAVSLQDHLGRPVLFHVWATWCSVCEAEEPELAALYEAYGADVDFVMVSIDNAGNGDAVRSETAAWPYENWWDPDDDVRPLFEVSYQPVTIFIAADGTIDAVWQGQRADRTTLRNEPDVSRAILDRLVAQA